MKEEKSGWQGENRRKIPREQDTFFRIVTGLNIFGWATFVASLIVFHYARPERVSGVQKFWGVTGRDYWLSDLATLLLLLLASCVSMSLLVLILKRRRNRRKRDYNGFGGIALLGISLLSLTAIFMSMRYP